MPEGLPEGVERWITGYGGAWPLTARGPELSFGTTIEVIAVSDLPAIIDRAKREERERIKAALREALLGDNGAFAWPRNGAALTMSKGALGWGLDRALAVLDHTEPQDEGRCERCGKAAPCPACGEGREP